MFIFEYFNIIFTIYIIGVILFFVLSVFWRGFNEQNMNGIWHDSFLWFVDIIYSLGSIAHYLYIFYKNKETK